MTEERMTCCRESTASASARLRLVLAIKQFCGGVHVEFRDGEKTFVVRSNIPRLALLMGASPCAKMTDDQVRVVAMCRRATNEPTRKKNDKLKHARWFPWLLG
eukprot:CAMPEP_0194522196 /NCGR_PEP_ID=MMETSP0253-20130528/56704_1 /TAXON_ID=2966 /ORGANISM="Noctiluca scintillans" /LENGTH=102 /DNA_ID=CAMNT_0039366609 /DNA_START=281 /DNA_END=586 /DNA_ORIENTATION=-